MIKFYCMPNNCMNHMFQTVMSWSSVSWPSSLFVYL